MSILLKKVLWFKSPEYSAAKAVNITDLLTFDSGNGVDIQNNMLTMNLKNAMISVNTLSTLTNQPFSKYVSYKGTSTSPEFIFKEQDMFKLYLKYTDDPADVISAKWASGKESDNTPPDEADLMGVYYLKDFNYNNGPQSSPLKLICADRTYIIFNRVFSGNYGGETGNDYTVPQLIKEIILRNCLKAKDNTKGGFTISGAKFELDARLESEGGLIQDERSDHSAFPQVDMAKIWKPVYEWVNELSQPGFTNTSDEIRDETMVYNKPFIFYVDELNRVHWYEMDNTVDPSNTYVVSEDNIYTLNLTKSIIDVVNMIIFNCGNDMNDHGILYYALNENTNIQGLKMQYLPFTNIAKDLITADYKITTTAQRGTDGYPTSYTTSGLSTAWSSLYDIYPPYNSLGKVTNDGEYNQTLRIGCKYQGLKKAQGMLSYQAEAKWRGTMDVKGMKIQAGTLFTLTDTRIGMYNQKLRANDIKHSVTKQGWLTNISFEEDMKGIFGGA